MNENNVIGKQSDLYKQLIDIYDCYDKPKDILVKRERFNRCFETVDKSEYEEICFVISLLKELDDVESSVIEAIQFILEILKRLLFSKEAKRNRFLLDLLEEARERKRPEN